MSTKKIYTKDDLIVRKLADFKKENGVISHTHTVEFGRPLNEIAPIALHDENPVFDPNRISVPTT